MWIKKQWKFWLAAISLSIIILSLSSYFFGVPVPLKTPGKVIDELNGVEVFYNGSFSHVKGRNLSSDGYNVGLRWQCVEFVKRYYLEFYNHKMPNSFGNAIDFFDAALKDGEINRDRDLIQFSNPSYSKPKVGDILIFKNGYGHVAIVSEVTNNEIEITQQNVGFKSRETLEYFQNKELYLIKNDRLVGWLRKN